MILLWQRTEDTGQSETHPADVVDTEVVAGYVLQVGDGLPDGELGHARELLHAEPPAGELGLRVGHQLVDGHVAAVPAERGAKVKTQVAKTKTEKYLQNSLYLVDSPM